MAEEARSDSEARGEQAVDSDTALRPINPYLSYYPQPMSERRARYEARRARFLRQKLPMGHPYRDMPPWVPYNVARMVGWLQRVSRLG
ncbi:hypothetical protein [Pseudoxanthobacter sp.]|uniref:hypothetical protein n=1 Tax=Pseudoxanthobacter sp. TaxID=1925742 RepID=UPI002FE0B760